MHKRPLALLALSLAFGAAHAQSSEHAKILDIQTFGVAGTTTTEAGGVSIVSPTMANMFTITVRIDDVAYSAEFHQGRKLRSSDFVVGDAMKVSIEKDKMLVVSPKGKEIKGRLVRRARLGEKGAG